MVPIELIRKKVIEFIPGADTTTLEEVLDYLSLRVHTSNFSYADLKEIILDMVESGILISEGSNAIKLNPLWQDIPEVPEYSIASYISRVSKIDISGNKKVHSIGSEDFSYNYGLLKNNDEISIELAPEPSNEYDENAVAILYDGKVLGYMERRHSQRYQSKIISYNVEQKSVIAKAVVTIEPELDDLKYLIIYLREPD